MTQRKYVTITKSEFEKFLANTLSGDWQEVHSKLKSGSGSRYVSNNSTPREYVYLHNTNYKTLYILVWSTISTRTDKSRAKGDDAIRSVIWDTDYAGVVSGRKKTLRIQTWRKNLREKLISMRHDTMDYVNPCDECDGWLVEKSSEYGKFLGCTNYPECDNTRDING